MKELFGMLAISVVVEALISWTTTLVVDKKFQWKVLAAVVIAELFAFNYSIDILEYAGITGKLPAVGIIASGIFMSRSSSYFYEIIQKIMSYKGSTFNVPVE